MPKLLIFAPCHRVLIDQDNNISLIEIFQEVRIPTTENIPSNAQAVFQWDVLAVWGQTPEDQGRTFEQDVMLIAPDGSTTSHTNRKFSLTARMHRSISRVYGFPIGLAGDYSLALKLRDASNEGLLVSEASYPLFVIHEPKPEGAP